MLTRLRTSHKSGRTNETRAKYHRPTTYEESRTSVADFAKDLSAEIAYHQGILAVYFVMYNATMIIAFDWTSRAT